MSLKATESVNELFQGDSCILTGIMWVLYTYGVDIGLTLPFNMRNFFLPLQEKLVCPEYPKGRGHIIDFSLCAQ